MAVNSKNNYHAYLIYQNDCFPPCGDAKNVLQCIVYGGRYSSEIPCPNHVEGSPEVLAGSLSGERLPYSWGTEEIDNKPLTFSLHEVIEVKV